MVLGWLLLFSGGSGCLLLGTMEMYMPRALKMTSGRRLGNFTYRGIIWHTFVRPNFALPNFAYS